MENIYKWLADNDYGFDRIMKSSVLASPGQYDPTTKTYTVRSYDDISGSIREEYLHMFQDFVYENGTSQYAREAGSTNIEFEAKFLQDLACCMYTDFACPKLASGNNYDKEYSEWMADLNYNKDREITYTDLMNGFKNVTYEMFLKDFAQKNNGNNKYYSE